MKKIMMGLALGLLSSQAMGYSSLINDELDNLYNEAIDNNSAFISQELPQHRLEKPRATIDNSYVISKTKELAGTWFLSFNVSGITYTDKIVIPGDANPDPYAGSFFISGLVYSGSSNGTIGNNGSLIICDYNPAAYSLVNSDYSCFAKDKVSGTTQNYYFKFTNNTVTGGYFGMSSTSTSAALDALKKDKPITGYRQGSTVGVITSAKPNNDQISCLFNWAESKYPQFFSSSNGPFLTAIPYTYRRYAATDYYLAVSSVDNHIYYMSGHDNVLHDAGDFYDLFSLTGC